MILNLTQHPATPEQIAAGVVEPAAETKADIKRLLTFSEPPKRSLLRTRASTLAVIAYGLGYGWAMIGGAPYLMEPLAAALRNERITPLFAFSERVSEEVDDGKGGVRKVSVFKHRGWVEG